MNYKKSGRINYRKLLVPLVTTAIRYGRDEVSLEKVQSELDRCVLQLLEQDNKLLSEHLENLRELM